MATRWHLPKRLVRQGGDHTQTSLIKMTAAQGLFPPIAVKGLIYSLDEIDKAYLASVPGNLLLNDTLTKEHIDAAHEYNTEQA